MRDVSIFIVGLLLVSVLVSVLAHFIGSVGPFTSRSRIIFCEKDVIRFYEKYADMHEESEIEIKESKERLEFLGTNSVDDFLKNYPSKDRACYYE
ncbi:hypothetical protein N9744_01285 [bacterium]|nr:hypothetical protein [bacterium]